jgi:type IV secretory pathway component VirB8
MAANITRVSVDSVTAMEQSITSYITQGFSVVNKTSDRVTLVKRKEFSVMWAVIGFLLCILPLLVYLVVYAVQSDQVVEIVVTSTSH